MSSYTKSIIPNGNFQEGKLGSLPDQWSIMSPYLAITPYFRLNDLCGQKILHIRGNGNENCVGYLYTQFKIHGGQSYKMKVRFLMSEGLDPNINLLFAFYYYDTNNKAYNNGIFRFYKLSDRWVEGENVFSLPDHGIFDPEVRIYFRFSSNGEAWIRDISLEECEPLPSRKVKLACTSGRASLSTWKSVLEFVGENQVDIVLLPEYFYHEFTNNSILESAESYQGPSCTLLSQQAEKYSMYTAGGFIYKDETDGTIYNNAVLFDRNGKLVGHYYKNHPFSPEIDLGITSGTEVPVFQTDFGCVGIMTCYDSWFTDIAELLALKGAEIILFPSAGYYCSLMPARAADNCVRIVASSTHTRCSIWDTSGVDPTCQSNCDGTFSDVIHSKVDNVEIIIATLDLNKSPSPHNWGGPMRSAPGGRRNRREQKTLLWDQIKAEYKHWWQD